MYYSSFYNEGIVRKITRRLREEPLVPIGSGFLFKSILVVSNVIVYTGFIATCAAFYYASASVRAGDRHRTNRMFRYRIYGQAFTLAAVVGGAYYYNADRLLQKELEAVKAQKKAKEKDEAWIKELEFRDQEEKEYEMTKKKVGEVQREAAKNTIADPGGGAEGGIVKAVKELKEVAQKTVKGAKETVEAQGKK